MNQPEISTPTLTPPAGSQFVTRDEIHFEESEYCTNNESLQICAVSIFKVDDHIFVFLQEHPLRNDVSKLPQSVIRSEHADYSTVYLKSESGVLVPIEKVELGLSSSQFPEFENTFIYKIPVSMLPLTNHFEISLPSIGYKKQIDIELSLNPQELLIHGQVEINKKFQIGEIGILFTEAEYIEAIMQENDLPGQPAQIHILGEIHTGAKYSLVGLEGESFFGAQIKDNEILISLDANSEFANAGGTVKLHTAYVVQEGPFELTLPFRYGDAKISEEIADQFLSLESLDRVLLEQLLVVKMVGGSYADIAIWSVACLVSHPVCDQEIHPVFQGNADIEAFVSPHRDRVVLISQMDGEVHILDLLTTEVSLVTSDSISRAQVIWHPNGEMFAISINPGLVKIYRFTPNGILQTDAFSDPGLRQLLGWSDSLGLLYFQENNGIDSLLSYKGGESSMVAETGKWFMGPLSPDGATLTLFDEESTWLYSLSEFSREQIENFNPGLMYWSPDNLKLISGLQLPDQCSWYLYEIDNAQSQHILTTNECNNFIWLDNEYGLITDDNSASLLLVDVLKLQTNLIPDELQNYRWVSIH